MTSATRVLVLGGRGFIGRAIVNALHREGADVCIGTRGQQRLKPGERPLSLHQLPPKEELLNVLSDIDVVVNSVGILRERPNESFEDVHHRGLQTLASACAEGGIKLLHISALGLEGAKPSNVLAHSKRQGEQALRDSGAQWRIIRASLVDGPGGYGASWFRRLAAWPIHAFPANSATIAPVHVKDLADAAALLAMEYDWQGRRQSVFEVACGEEFSVPAYLERLRGRKPWFTVAVPHKLMSWLVRLCDRLDFTPLSDGHYELLQRRNAPKSNCLPILLGRAPQRVLANRETRQAGGVRRWSAA